MTFSGRVLYTSKKGMKTSTIICPTIAIVILISCFSGKTIESDDRDIYSGLRSGKALVVTNRTILSPLDFEKLFKDHELSHEITGEIQFVNCIFEEDVRWASRSGKNLVFRDDVVFRDCIFQKSFTISDARFDGRFFLTSSLIRNSLDLQRNTFQQRARIEDNEIGNDIIMQYTRVKDDLSLFESKAGRDILMQGMSIQGKTQMGNVECNGALDLSNGDFHEVFSANYVRVGRKVLAGNSRFFGDFSMNSLETAGTVNLEKSRAFSEYVLETTTDSASIIHATAFDIR